MASEEDDALLFLIYQHLKHGGYKKAAKGLQKHLPQVETTEESSNLHDIYTGWMKLGSLAQHAKQETEDSTAMKTESIKREPATSEEEEGEGADSKLSNIPEENHVDTKPPSESMTEAESVSEPCQLPEGDAKTTNSEGDDGQEEKERKKRRRKDKRSQSQLLWKSPLRRLTRQKAPTRRKWMNPAARSSPHVLPLITLRISPQLPRQPLQSRKRTPMSQNRRQKKLQTPLRSQMKPRHSKRQLSIKQTRQRPRLRSQGMRKATQLRSRARPSPPRQTRQLRRPMSSQKRVKPRLLQSLKSKRRER
nr:CWF19-like protein 2 homolog [Labrus bergylta]XP_029134706.1 CWF19-like protein 2 homolog [Labrus bergylta]